MSNTTIFEKTVVDPVLAEVRRIKEEIAAEHGYDIAKIIAAARRSQAAHPERIVNRIPIGAEGGADQPATAPESKSEDSQNTEPDSEARSQ